jgi:hypothetical protein
MGPQPSENGSPANRITPWVKGAFALDKNGKFLILAYFKSRL